MIREMLKLGVAAAKTEAKLLLDKVLDKTAPSSPAPDPEPSTWRSSGEGHTKMLASLECECGATKLKGSYFCPDCASKIQKERSK